MLWVLNMWCKSFTHVWFLLRLRVLHPTPQICHILRVSLSPEEKYTLYAWIWQKLRWFRVKNNDFYFLPDLLISRAERFKVIFSFFNLKNTLRSTELIHVFAVVRTIPLYWGSPNDNWKRIHWIRIPNIRIQCGCGSRPCGGKVVFESESPIRIGCGSKVPCGKPH